MKKRRAGKAWVVFTNSFVRIIRQYVQSADSKQCRSHECPACAVHSFNSLICQIFTSLLLLPSLLSLPTDYRIFLLSEQALHVD